LSPGHTGGDFLLVEAVTDSEYSVHFVGSS